MKLLHFEDDAFVSCSRFHPNDVGLVPFDRGDIPCNFFMGFVWCFLQIFLFLYGTGDLPSRSNILD